MENEDKFEQWLIDRIADTRQRWRDSKGASDGSWLKLKDQVILLEECLEEYRKHKQDAHVFRVGDRVLDDRGELRTIEEYYEGIKQEDYVVARGGKFNDLGVFRVGHLTRIEEGEA
jgi:hypothetical protein